MTNSEYPNFLDPKITEARQVGYRAIDMIIDHRFRIGGKSVHNEASRVRLDRAFAEDIPEKGISLLQVMDIVERKILNATSHTDHPRFFGYVPSPGNFAGTIADTLRSGFNVFAGHWLAGSAPAAIEAITIDWLRSLMGFPQQSGGIFVSGGSIANLTALHAARVDSIGDGHNDSLIVYGTNQSHSCIGKALRILGFSADQFRMVSTDQELRMDWHALEAEIDVDRRNGRRPFLVAATAGTTNTGAVDPLIEIRRICDAQRLWMHVDGAYGAAAYICNAGRGILVGLDLSDSLVLDPHKWWFQPYEIGCVLLRSGNKLRQAYAVHADYLREAANSGSTQFQDSALGGEINFYDLGPQLTRSFRALKLWMFIKMHGIAKIRALIERGIAAAEIATEIIEKSDDWEIVTDASLGILTFRPSSVKRRKANHIRRAVNKLMASGFALITTTEVRGETVFRLCPIHPSVRKRDIKATLDELVKAL